MPYSDSELVSKVCTKCKESRPVNEFYKNKRGREGWRSVCKICWPAGKPEYQKEWCEKNKEHRREYHLQKTYGISSEDYNRMLAEQKGLCKICKQPPRSRTKQFLFVDHDHVTKIVRGLLCNICNRWLGLWERNREIFSQFETYLRAV